MNDQPVWLQVLLVTVGCVFFIVCVMVPFWIGQIRNLLRETNVKLEVLVMKKPSAVPEELVRMDRNMRAMKRIMTGEDEAGLAGQGEDELQIR